MAIDNIITHTISFTYILIVMVIHLEQ